MAYCSCPCFKCGHLNVWGIDEGDEDLLEFPLLSKSVWQ